MEVAKQSRKKKEDNKKKKERDNGFSKERDGRVYLDGFLERREILLKDNHLTVHVRN